MTGFRGADPEGLDRVASRVEILASVLGRSNEEAYGLVLSYGRWATADGVASRLASVVRTLTQDGAELHRRATLVQAADALVGVAGLPRSVVDSALQEGDFALIAPLGVSDWEAAYVAWRDGPAIPELVAMDPAGVAAALAAASPRALNRLVLEAPEVIGALDGVPPRARYTANRLLVQHEIERLEEVAADLNDELWRVPSAEDLSDPFFELRREVVRLELEEVDEVIARYRLWAGEHRQLLLFDPAGDGRVAEVFGDLDDAHHVAVVVPGITNDISNFGPADGDGFRVNARDLHDAAMQLDGSVATIAWLGYDTPDGADAVLRNAADNARDDLIRFLDGLVAEGDRHVSVIGHSYGSLVTGMAAGVGVPADEVVFVGSPGTSLDHAGDANLPPGGQVWAGLASWDMIGVGVDPIPNSLWEAVLGIGGNYLWEVATTGDLATEHLWHGRNPAHESFGAVEFTTDGATGHSQYFDPGTESLDNLARIITGLTPTVAVLSSEPMELAPGPFDPIDPGWGGEIA